MPKIMINLLIHHEVADYTAWKAAFDASFDWRHKNGECSCRIFRSAGNVNDVNLFFEWESLEKARAFVASDELKAKMASAGVMGAPRVDFLTEVQSVRRSAAD
ncbi:MAG: cyclase [Acidobacteriia bacterium]|nr:cyclase [Terriglobia bacterium]